MTEVLPDVDAEQIAANQPLRNRIRARADGVKKHRCKNLIAVIENPANPRNIGSVLRNVNALGVDKAYIVDSQGILPKSWDAMRADHSLSKFSVSAVKWSFIKRFDSTEACLDHLEKNRFVSMVTSPHVKGRENATLDDVDFTVDHKLAIWFGNERTGISDLAVSRSILCVSIPMFGMIESFNLGTTSGIVLYQAAKQRRAYQEKFRKRHRKSPKRTA